LRERLDALPLLVSHFLSRFNTRFAKNVHTLDEASQHLLKNYPYPGNIRELESIIAHAVIMAEGETLHVTDFPDQVRHGVAQPLALPNYATQAIPTITAMEKQLIQSTLERLDGNHSEVARRLGISRSTLWRKMKEYGITSGG
jgi:transcriptional regulator with PAS, ATPase and Fis domain